MFISEAMAQTVQTATNTATTSGSGIAAFAQLILMQMKLVQI